MYYLSLISHHLLSIPTRNCTTSFVVYIWKSPILKKLLRCITLWGLQGTGIFSRFELGGVNDFFNRSDRLHHFSGPVYDGKGYSLMSRLSIWVQTKWNRDSQVSWTPKEESRPVGLGPCMCGMSPEDWLSLALIGRELTFMCRIHTVVLLHRYWLATISPNQAGFGEQVWQPGWTWYPIEIGSHVRFSFLMKMQQQMLIESKLAMRDYQGEWVGRRVAIKVSLLGSGSSDFLVLTNEVGVCCF
jgi:hypothetical protein